MESPTVPRAEANSKSAREKGQVERFRKRPCRKQDHRDPAYENDDAVFLDGEGDLGCLMKYFPKCHPQQGKAASRSDNFRSGRKRYEIFSAACKIASAILQVDHVVGQLHGRDDVEHVGGLAHLLF